MSWWWCLCLCLWSSPPPPVAWAAAVSPPRWADPQRNPCAALPGGWQLLQWPGDGRCYRIFTVGAPGPCPPTQELAPHARTGAATCRCPPGSARLRLRDDPRCYALFSRGPCARGHYFAPLPLLPPHHHDEDGSSDSDSSVLRVGTCLALGRCDSEGDVFWPATRSCYAPLTRGPCPRGELLLPPANRKERRPSDHENDTDPSAQVAAAAADRSEEDEEQPKDQDEDDDGLPRCGCSSQGALASHYWSAATSSTAGAEGGEEGGGGDGAGGVGVAGGGGGACYEHFTRGPCLEEGHLFLPGGVCGCHEALPHFHNATRRCYQLGTAGPCPAGHHFVAAPGEAHARCRCKEGHVPWTGGGVAAQVDNGAGACYRLYTRGPCPEGQFLLDMATCATLCQRGRLYFPQHNICYRVGLRGPCPRGQIVLFEDSVRPSLDGISYRGMCGCPNGVRRCTPPPIEYSRREGEQQQGEGEDTTSSSLCDAKAGMVRWNGTCYTLYARGPCPESQWLVPARQGRLRWDAATGGWRRKQSSARCDCRPGHRPLRGGDDGGGGGGGGELRCQPPTVSLAKFLNDKYHHGQPSTTRRGDEEEDWW